MKEPATSYIGLDIHKESIAMAIADADADRAAPRFIGTINPVPAELCKAMRRKLAQNKICVAIARELAGFIWDVARHVKVNP